MWYEYRTVKEKLPTEVREVWTVKGVVENTAKIEDKTYLIDAVTGSSYSYKETNIKSNKYANSLINFGLTKGSAVGIYLNNGPEYVFTLFGCGKAGVMEIPINVNFREPEITHIINSAGISTIIIESNPAFLSEIAKVSKATSVLKNVLVIGEISQTSTIPATLNSLDEMVSKANSSNPNVKIEENDPFCAFFTSGTTGMPKGAPISNKNFLLAAESFLCAPVSREDRNYTCLPLFHANAQCYSMMGSMCLGSSLVLSDKFSPKRFFEEIKNNKVSYFNYIGGILQILNASFKPEEAPDHGARLTLGAPSVPDGWEEKFNVMAMEMYSLSEAPVLFGNVDPDESRVKKGSFGLPLFPDLGRQVRVVDDRGNDVAVGEVGELIQKGKNFITDGYLGNPEATKESIDKDGWFHTGDLVKQDKDGYFYYVDRKKFMIRKGGENIATAEIETIVNSYPAVESSAAIPAPDPIREEEVKIFIKLAANQGINFEDLIKHCSTKLAYYKIPRYIEIIDEFPKTATERIQKMKLKQQEREKEDHGWDRDKEIPNWRDKYYGSK